MKKKGLFLLLCLALSCTSKEIDYLLPFEGEKLWVEGILKTTEIIQIRVLKTVNPTGKISASVLVPDAVVKIYENGVLLEILSYKDKGYYTSLKHYKPKAGKAYFVEVTHTTLPKTTSKPIIVPENRPIFSYSQENDIDDGYADEIRVHLQNDSTKYAYYGIVFKAITDIPVGIGYESLDADYTSLIKSDCLYQTSIKIYEQPVELFLYSNRCFATNKPTFRFAVRKTYNEPSTIPNDFRPRYVKAKYIELRVMQCEKEYSEYLKLKNQPEEIQRAFEEPRPTYTNMVGGYGIVGAVHEYIVQIPVECSFCIR